MEKRAEILSDLLLITRDCTRAFESLIRPEDKNSAQGLLLRKLVDIERGYLVELRRQHGTSFGDPADAVERRGDLYKSWQQNVSHVAPSEKQHVYRYCEMNAKALAQAYALALNSSSGFSDHIVFLFTDHVRKVKEVFASFRSSRSATKPAVLEPVSA